MREVPGGVSRSDGKRWSRVRTRLQEWCKFLVSRGPEVPVGGEKGRLNQIIEFCFLRPVLTIRVPYRLSYINYVDEVCLPLWNRGVIVYMTLNPTVGPALVTPVCRGTVQVRNGR